MSSVSTVGVELDLMGQEIRESAGTRQLSGIGGQMDFLEGAFRSRRQGLYLPCFHPQEKDGSLKSTSYRSFRAAAPYLHRVP